MKRFLGIIIVAIFIFSIPQVVNANETPVYDASFNQNQGVFYANGTSITIDENSNGETVIYWDGGEQVVPTTVTVFGGGTANSSYNSSNITMNGGTVSYIYGGGFSTEENNSANVENTNIIVNGGTVLRTVYGGGLLYTTVGTSNVIINNGTIAAVQGGGAASSTILGVTYSTGTEDNPQNSGTRVENANVTINGGIINSNSLNYGLVYGGGQGYSYTGTATLAINGGDMSNAYVTSAGSNGYTGSTSTTISGGTINIFQNVNRGMVQSATLSIIGGEIKNLYLGGETGDSSVTGTIQNVTVSILGGTITNLGPGTSDGEEIIVDQDDYKIVYVDGTVENSSIGDNEIVIIYNFEILNNEISLYKKQTEKIQTVITTDPTGYESLFEDVEIIFSSANPSIAQVDENGLVTGINSGTTTITVDFLNEQQIVTVEVLEATNYILITLIVIIILFVLLIVFYISCICCRFK